MLQRVTETTVGVKHQNYKDVSNTKGNAAELCDYLLAYSRLKI